LVAIANFRISNRFHVFLKPVRKITTTARRATLALSSKTTQSVPHVVPVQQAHDGTASSIDDEDTDRRTASGGDSRQATRNIEADVEVNTANTNTSTSTLPHAISSTAGGDTSAGWVVEFVFPESVAAFGNLQKKSIRVNPVQPMRTLVAMLIDKVCAECINACACCHAKKRVCL
jgi:hypothetical protein